MSKGMMTEIGREKFCKAHAGDISLPKVKYMVFGDGGVDSDKNPIAPLGTEVSLRNELLRKEINSHTYPVNTTCRYTMTLEKGELEGKYISEMGLIDVEGDLIAYETFLAKGKDGDMRFIFDLDEIF